MIFSGGLPQDRPGRSASITVIHGRSTTVLEMEHNVVDFVTLTDSPWPSGNDFTSNNPFYNEMQKNFILVEVHPDRWLMN
jgi:syntaxin-binding protein 5